MQLLKYMYGRISNMYMHKHVCSIHRYLFKISESIYKHLIVNSSYLSGRNLFLENRLMETLYAPSSLLNFIYLLLLFKFSF